MTKIGQGRVGQGVSGYLGMSIMSKMPLNYPRAEVDDCGFSSHSQKLLMITLILKSNQITRNTNKNQLCRISSKK